MEVNGVKAEQDVPQSDTAVSLNGPKLPVGKPLPCHNHGSAPTMSRSEQGCGWGEEMGREGG